MKKLLETKTYCREVSEFNEEVFEVVDSTEENSEILYDIADLYRIDKEDVSDPTKLDIVYDDESLASEDYISSKYFIADHDMPEKYAEIVRGRYENLENALNDLEIGQSEEDFKIEFENFVKEKQYEPWFRYRVLYHLGEIVETLEDENGSTLWIEDTNNRFDCETLDKKLLPTEVMTLRRNADGEYFKVSKSLYQDSYSLYFYPISEEEAENF